MRHASGRGTRVRAVNWRRGLLIVLLGVLAVSAVCAAIPDDEYQRFQLLDKSSQRGIRWVYERIHYDDDPIDVVVIGSSRTGAGVDAARLEHALALSGRADTVVNFSLPEEGRDLHWVVAEQVLRAKRPKLMILGVVEQPAREGNPGYKYVAPAADVVDPAYVINRNYLGNLIYLPYRQLYLLFANVLPGVAGLERDFDPMRYANSSGIVWLTKHGNMSEAALRARDRTFEQQVRPPLLPPRYADFEFGNERAYIRRIAGLAKASGTRLVFLYMPHYDGPPGVVEDDFYRAHGRLLNPGFVAHDSKLYYNLAHLNERGAAVLTDWLVPQVAALL